MLFMRMFPSAANMKPHPPYYYFAYIYLRHKASRVLHTWSSNDLFCFDSKKVSSHVPYSGYWYQESK